MGIFQNPIGLPFLGLDRNYSANQIPSLEGKVAIVTGGSRGIGYETSLALARAGARVYIAGQSQPNADAAIKKIKETLGGTGDLHFLHLKLQSIVASIAAGREFLSREARLDIIIANAGVNVKNQLSEDGIEQDMAINHVGHYAFITTVLPRVLETTKVHNVATHIVITSSHSHFDIKSPHGFQFADFTKREEHMSQSILDANTRYARSKLANVLFTIHLSELLQTPEYKAQGGDRVFVNAAHPGLILTDMVDGVVEMIGPFLGFLLGWLVYFLGLSVADGALTQIFLATSPKIEQREIRGKYFVPIAKEIPANRVATAELAKELWDWTDARIRKASEM